VEHTGNMWIVDHVERAVDTCGVWRSQAAVLNGQNLLHGRLGLAGLARLPFSPLRQELLGLR
jgi:hypothetical protein